MSALGQKQTYAAHKLMSALPPIATAKADARKRSCLLYPQKRTCAVQESMSAKGQKRTSRLIRLSRRRGRDFHQVSFVMNGNTSIAAALTGPFWHTRQI